MGNESTLAWMTRDLLSRRFDDNALELARHALLDTAGCIIAGKTSEQAARLEAMLAASGEDRLSTTALKLGVAAHAIDFDDYEEVASTHPSAVLVPVLMSLASEHDGISLGELLSAYIAGYETILTLGKVVGYGHYMAGWHSTSTLGRPGAAMAAARLLGLDPDQAVTAVSLAMTQSAGLKAQFGTDAKALHAGLAARTGVEAALLARVGFSATAQIADGPFGFAGVFGTAASHGWQAVRSNDLPSTNSYPPFVKPSPSCGYTIRPIEAATIIAAREHFNASDVTKICVRMPEPYYQVAGYTNPYSAHEARFSASYCVAVALIDGDVGVAAFNPDSLQRPDVRALMARIDFDPYELPAGAGDMSPLAPDTVTVTLRDGRHFVETVALARGGADRLMTGSEIAAKYASCGGRKPSASKLLNARLDEPFGIETLIYPA